MIGINFLWTVGFFFSNLLQCYPISVNWSGFGYAEGKCIDVNLFSKIQTFTDIGMNGEIPFQFLGWRLGSKQSTVFIIALPLPCVSLASDMYTLPLVDKFQIWALKMPLVKKVAVGGIFLLGAL